MVGTLGDYSLPVWPEGFTAVPDASGRVVVRDDKGAVVAIEGERFGMGGGYTAEFRPANKVQPRDEQIKQVEEWLGYQIPGRCLSSDVYGVLGRRRHFRVLGEVLISSPSAASLEDECQWLT